MNIILPVSVVHGIMGWLDFMYEFMHVCKSVGYVYLCIRKLVCMHICVYVWRIT